MVVRPNAVDAVKFCHNFIPSIYHVLGSVTDNEFLLSARFDVDRVFSISLQCQLLREITAFQL